MQTLHGRLAFAALFVLLSTPPVQAQADRFARFEPGLIVETGARVGACDVLAFTADGNHLLATGDDKVVRSWRFAGDRLESELDKTLRWSVFREQRGSIYAMALSPEKENRHVAVGGWGVRVGAGSVAVIDRATAEVKAALKNQTDNYVVWSLAGDGRWRSFDLSLRKWVDPRQPVERVRRLESLEGWRVKPDPGKATLWHVVPPDGAAPLPLPLTVGDDLPRCFTFLPRQTKDQPPRLAVGHYWGVSVFELSPSGVRRSRLYTGHHGEVLALGFAAERNLLVSASRDQTIVAWDLSDWRMGDGRAESELGTRVSVNVEGRLAVGPVAVGSPAWEAGPTPGDEVLTFAHDGRQLYDPDKHMPAALRARYRATDMLTQDACLRHLRSPEPGKECYFRLRRKGAKDVIETATSVRRRPLWRFFPTRDGEWALWRWRDYYYDASTNGDTLIGWQVSGDVDQTPAFYRAEQFRQRFYRPDKVQEMLDGKHDAERVRFPDLEPPEVKLALNGDHVADKVVRVSLSARPRGVGPNQKLVKAVLWVNDYQFRSYVPDGAAFPREETIPRGLLRGGDNLLTLQCENHAGGRGEAAPLTLTLPVATATPRLFGLLVGVGDYSQSLLRKQGSKLRLGDLNADKDADAMLQIWKEQKGKLYEDVEIKVLLNRQATPKAILDHLHGLAERVRPDDRFLLFLGGHGTSAEELRRLVQLSKTPVVDELTPRGFAMLGPEFDIGKPNRTGVTSLDLYQAIVQLNCHKLILLDACHSGAIAVNPVRELTRDGVGPVIVAACQPNEQAIEFGLLDANRSYGLFTMALRRGLEEEFDDGDRDGDKSLSATELVEFVRGRVPRLVDELKESKIEGIRPGDTQTPRVFLPRLERDLPWAKK